MFSIGDDAVGLSACQRLETNPNDVLAAPSMELEGSEPKVEAQKQSRSQEEVHLLVAAGSVVPIDVVQLDDEQWLGRQRMMTTSRRRLSAEELPGVC